MRRSLRSAPAIGGLAWMLLIGGAEAGPARVELLSRGAFPADTAGAFTSTSHSMSADGRYLAFESSAANLVPGQVATGETFNVFLRDRVAGTTTLVSRAAGSPVTGGNGDSSGAVMSADGRFLAFVSEATNLVSDQVDANGDGDVFLHDRETGTTTLVSRTGASTVTTGNGRSILPAISADGKFVAFHSRATNLVPGQVDANGDNDVFLYERETGTTTLVSRTPASALFAGNGVSQSPAISADGQFVTFQSEATDLILGQVDGNGGADVFLHDRGAGTTTLVSRTAASAVTTGNARSFARTISADGRFVAFSSLATDLVGGQVDANGNEDVFLYDRVGATTTLVSRTAVSAVTTGNSFSLGPFVSADGQFVAFASLATDLVAGQVDANLEFDVFLYDRVGATTTLVSRTAASAVTTGNRFSFMRALSADGRFVVVDSGATNLVAGQVDANQSTDVFVYDRVAGATTLVSRTAGSAVTAGNSFSDSPVISADGGSIAFESVATDLVTGVTFLTGDYDAFVYDQGSATTTVVSLRDPAAPGDSGAGASALGPAAVSADGRFVVFTSLAGNLVADQVEANIDTDVFLRDRAAGTTTLVSHAVGSSVTTGNAFSDSPIMSADGRLVAFASGATDLVTGQVDANGRNDVFLYDREVGTTTLVSRAVGSTATTGNGGASVKGLSADGRFVLFDSDATDLVTGQVDVNFVVDVFLYDREEETTTLVSRTAASAVTTGNGPFGSTSFGLSTDGRFVAFATSSTDLVAGQTDANGTTDVFLYDREAGTTTLVSRTAASVVTTGNGLSSDAALSADGRFVAFRSAATDLVTGQVDNNGADDVFLYDRVAGTTTLVSRTSASAVTTGDARSDNPAVSAGGEFVAFESQATDLVAGQLDANGTRDLFLYDRVAGTTTLVSRTAASAVTAGGGASPALSADGRFVVFESRATDLVEGQVDATGTPDLFLYDRQAATTVLLSQAVRGADRRRAASGNGFSDSPALSADGSVVAFRSAASNLTTDRDVNGVSDVFVVARPCAGPTDPRPCPGVASRPTR